MTMTAAERLALIRFKIERAKEHITYLNSAINDFFNSKPYQVNTKRDTNGRLIYYLSSVKPTPTRFAIIAGDAIQNLRSTLDHLAWQLFLVGTGGTTNEDQIYFPIAGDATKYNSKLRGLSSCVRRDAITMLNTIQPYNGGTDHKLWILHKLNNIDKHRLLVTVGSVYQSFNVGKHITSLMQTNEFGIPIPKMDLYLKPKDNLFPLKTGDELFIDAVNAQENKELDFRFNIALNEPGVIEGATLLELLNEFSDIVTKTVLLFMPCLT